MFSKLGWQGARTIVSLSFAYAHNYLTGNGLQEERFLARDYASGYTYGDTTTNRSPFFNLSVPHAVSGTLTYSGNAYFRYIRADSVNPNLTRTRSMSRSTSRQPPIRRRLRQPGIRVSRRAARTPLIRRSLIGAASLKDFSFRNPSRSAMASLSGLPRSRTTTVFPGKSPGRRRPAVTATNSPSVPLGIGAA
jgi:hypothetical protein